MEGRGHGGDKSLPCSSWFLPCPWSQPRALRTHVSWSPAGRGEYTARVLHLGEAKVGDHDLGVFIQVVVQQILWLRGQEGGEGAVRDGQAPPSKQWAPKSPCGFTAALSWRHTKLKEVLKEIKRSRKDKDHEDVGGNFPVKLRYLLWNPKEIIFEHLLCARSCANA